MLHFGQLERVEELHRLDDRLFRKLRNVQSAERYRQHLRAQTAAVARRTWAFAHHLFNLAARPLAVGFAVAAFQIGDDALERLAHHAARNAADRQLERLIARAVQQLVERLLGELLDGRFKRKAVLFAERGVVHTRDRTRVGAAPAGGADSALLDGKMAVRDNAIRVNALLDAQTRAHRTRAVWVVKREHARGQFLNGNAAVVAGVVLRERDGFTADNICNHQTAGQRRRGLHRIRNASARVRTDDNAVNNDLNVVLLGFRQLEFFGQIVNLAVHAHADIALLAGVLKHLVVLALLAADDRREQLHARLFFKRHQPVDDLVDGLLVNLLTAFRAVRRADARPQQAHIVINLRHRADRRTRVLRGGLLVDGDGGRQTVNVVHVRLVHLPQKLPRIAGQRFNVAALTLGVDRVKRQGRFARAGQAGEHHQLVARNLDVDVFQVVLSRTFNVNVFLHFIPLGNNICPAAILQGFL